MTLIHSTKLQLEYICAHRSINPLGVVQFQCGLVKLGLFNSVLTVFV